MKRISCEICGSSDIVKQENIFKCSDCGKEYSVEEIENKTQEKETSTQQQNINNSIVEILDNSIQPNESNNPQENKEGKNDALSSLLMGLAILTVIFIISSIVLTISSYMTEKKNKITSCISTVMSQKIGNKHFDIEEKNGSFYVSWRIDDINIEAKVKVNFSDTGFCESLDLIDIKRTSSHETFAGRYAADVGEELGLRFSDKDTARMRRGANNIPIPVKENNYIKRTSSRKTFGDRYASDVVEELGVKFSGNMPVPIPVTEKD